LDWTLLYTGGAGLRALNHAFLRLHGIPEGAKGVTLDGKTDPAICREMIRSHLKRDASPAEIKAMCDAYLEQLAIEVPISPGFKILPGIPQILEALSKRSDVLMALGTGNLKRGAEIKLKRPDFWRYFDVGGYADDSEIRSELLAAAVRRANEKVGKPFAPRDVIVIGDTLHDIHAARAIGATIVAVASGTVKAEVLASEHPDILWPDLANTDEVLKRLL